MRTQAPYSARPNPAPAEGCLPVLKNQQHSIACSRTGITMPSPPVVSVHMVVVLTQMEELVEVCVRWIASNLLAVAQHSADLTALPQDLLSKIAKVRGGIGIRGFCWCWGGRRWYSAQ